MSKPDFVIKVKVEDNFTGRILDTGKVSDVPGWKWLIRKYGYKLVRMDWEDFFAICNMNNVSEVVDYVERKKEKREQY